MGWGGNKGSTNFLKAHLFWVIYQWFRFVSLVAPPQNRFSPGKIQFLLKSECWQPEFGCRLGGKETEGSYSPIALSPGGSWKTGSLEMRTMQSLSIQWFSKHFQKYCPRYTYTYKQYHGCFYFIFLILPQFAEGFSCDYHQGLNSIW